MRRPLAATLLLAATLALPAPAMGQSGPEADEASEDVEAVRRAVLDYVEAIYRTEPDRIERSVSPELAKVGWYRSRDAADYASATMTYDELLETARTWNRDGRDLSAAPRQITVFDVLDRVATAKLVAAWGIDYLHLVKEGDAWAIRHVVWQSHTPETAAGARAARAEGPGGGPGG